MPQLEGPTGHYATSDKPVTKKTRTGRVHIYVPKIIKFTETESKLVVTRGLGAGCGGKLFNEY